MQQTAMLTGAISDKYISDFEALQKLLLDMTSMVQDIPNPETATYTDFATLAAVLEKAQNAHNMLEQWTNK